MVHSCGGVLYTIKDGFVYIVLGKEGSEYFHFKGRVQDTESFEDAAVREIREETMGLVNLDTIYLDCHNVSSKNKKYHYGLVKVDNDIDVIFNAKRNNSNVVEKLMPDYKEKQDIKLFKLNDIKSHNLHVLTIKPIMYYYDFLVSVQDDLGLCQ